MLSSFEIVNFRTFSHLRIERLGRVNLVVGKNNVGKTTLLEALRFYAMGSATALRECLVSRDELRRYGPGSAAQLDLRSLFHGRPHDRGKASLGPLGQPDRNLAVRMADVERVEYSDGRYHYEEYDDEGIAPEGEIFSGLVIERDGTRVLISPEPTQRALGQGRYVGPAFVPARGVRESDLVQWWDEISLTGGDERVVEWLSLMAPVERVAAVEDPIRRDRRMFKVRLFGEKEPLPLKTLGEGPYRVFQVATAIEYAFQAPRKREPDSLGDQDDESWGAKDLVLIDEIENGVHHTVHADLWKALLQAAREHNLQVFATTHSSDCLKGFEQAIAENEEADGLVIRLERVEGEAQTGAVIIDRDALPAVVRDSIEVR
ncbi:MAG TPA: AAA family ATPase [Thermoguttaceae bacterium]|nr:AAA family ATPase [Thermoguttaceae bacterium]